MQRESRLKKNQEFEHILFCIGEGSIYIEEIRRWFADDLSAEQSSFNLTKEPETESENGANIEKLSAADKKSLIIVGGLENVSTRIAKCCSPTKNQSILGYLTKERVITIHKKNCLFIKKLAPERKLEVMWGKGN
jgi:(p)ppGpp synthase/HD superfamily hydrolase